MNEKRILLVFPTPIGRQAFSNTFPPLGILGIASFLESKSIKADVVDCHVQKDMPDFNDYDVICFSVNIANVQNTIQYIKEIREGGGKQKIIIGGPQNHERGSFWIEKYNVDAVVIGEGEYTIYEFLTSNDISQVKGLLYNNNGKAVFTGDRVVPMKLDEFPFPALDKVNIRKYNSPIKKEFPISTIVTSRGCPEKCTFCNSRLGIWRQRSVKHVVDEIEWQVNELGVKELYIADDSFTLNRQRAWDIAEEILRRGIKFKFQLKNGIRVDKVDKELLAKLKEAGLWLVAVAPESGSQDTLDRFQKGFTLERVKQAVKWCKELDLNTFALFILGLPWETEEDIQRTVDFANELDTDFVQFARYTPIIGTPLYEEVKKEGLLMENEFIDHGTHQGTVNYKPKLIDQEIMNKIFKKAYRSFYLKPRRMWKIYKILSLRDIYFNVKFSFMSGSM